MNEMENPESDPPKYGNLIFDRGPCKSMEKKLNY